MYIYTKKNNFLIIVFALNYNVFVKIKQNQILTSFIELFNIEFK